MSSKCPSGMMPAPRGLGCVDAHASHASHQYGYAAGGNVRRAPRKFQDGGHPHTIGAPIGTSGNTIESTSWPIENHTHQMAANNGRHRHRPGNPSIGGHRRGGRTRPVARGRRRMHTGGHMHNMPPKVVGHQHLSVPWNESIANQLGGYNATSGPQWQGPGATFENVGSQYTTSQQTGAGGARPLGGRRMAAGGHTHFETPHNWKSAVRQASAHTHMQHQEPDYGYNPLNEGAALWGQPGLSANEQNELIQNELHIHRQAGNHPHPTSIRRGMKRGGRTRPVARRGRRRR